MRLDARKGDQGLVWDCERCCKIDPVQWVEDDPPCYGIFINISISNAIRTVQAKKIVIYGTNPRYVILVNPVEDNEQQDVVEDAQRRMPSTA